MFLSPLFCFLARSLGTNYDTEISKFRELTPYMELEYTVDGAVRKETIKFDLFWDVTPKTALNFARLIEGYEGSDKKQYSYKGSVFHRIIKDFMMQGGDMTNHDGTGGYCTFGTRDFADENFTKKHEFGVLSMANRGPNTNGSQFFITFKDLAFLDGGYVVFGKLHDDHSRAVVKEIEKVETNKATDRPTPNVKVLDCGFIKNHNETL